MEAFINILLYLLGSAAIVVVVLIVIVSIFIYLFNSAFYGWDEDDGDDES